MDAVLERDNCSLTIAWKDSAGEPATPSSAGYRVDDIDSGQQIRGNTSLTATSSVTIQLMYADTQILNQNNAEEGRRLTAWAVFGTDGDGNPIQKTVEYNFTVKNTRFRSL